MRPQCVDGFMSRRGRICRLQTTYTDWRSQLPRHVENGAETTPQRHKEHASGQEQSRGQAGGNLETSNEDVTTRVGSRITMGWTIQRAPRLPAMEHHIEHRGPLPAISVGG